jgi:acetylornithine deacetylase/succinyl-diaminopimelate desuccinylase-like protein
MQLTVYGPVHGLHSGHYGNWAPNPGMMLAQLLASMKDADGNVLIKGFYDTVTPLTETERAALATVPDMDAELMREFGLARTEGDGTLAERILLPSLNVSGLASAQVGPGTRNVIPPTATAALGIRLVKGNDPQDMQDRVEAHIRGRGYAIVREDPDPAFRLAHPRIAKVVRGTGYVAARTSMDHPFVGALIAAARAAAGEDIVLQPGLGGSLPLYLFTERWDVPMVIVPIANHDDNQHTADENLRIANLWYGIDLMASILAMPQP